MLERRQFLGSIAAVASLSATGLVARANPFHHADGTEGPDLNWRCDVIQTVGQPPRNRAPVITGISLDGTNDQMAVVGDDHLVSIYNFEKRRFTDFLTQHTDWVRTAQFRPGQKVLVTAGNDRRILLWDSTNWGSASEIARHPAAIINLAFSSDGNYLATVGFEGTTRVYDMNTGSLFRPFEGNCADNHAVAFSPDNQLLAIGGRSGAVHVWDVASGREVADFQAHRQRVRSLRFLPDGRIVSCSEDQIVRISGPDFTTPVEALPRESAKQFDVLVLDRKTIATARSDNRIAVWDIETGKQLGVLNGHTGTVSCLAADASRLVSGSYDTQIRVWNRTLDASVSLQRHTQLEDGWNQKIK